MADTSSWTEPRGSTRYLGVECELWWSEMREAVCVSGAVGISIRKWRWTQYVRGAEMGQCALGGECDHRARERGSLVDELIEVTLAHGHGGRGVCSARIWVMRSVPMWQCGQRSMLIRATRCQKARTDSGAVVACASAGASSAARAWASRARLLRLASRP